jgi:four helix bundle protein
MYRDPILRRLVFQLVDAAGSIGANLEEAAEAQSKRDFIAKNCIALKEARESRFWLMLIASVEKQLKERVQVLTDEASELVAMLGAVVKTARSNPGRGRQIET